MSNSPAPKSAKWPFLLGDLLLVAAAGAIVAQGRPLGPWQAIAIVAAVALGAWILIQPFLKDQDIEGQLEELNRLGDTVKQINKIEDAADRIGRASTNWHGVQTEAGKTLEAVQAISDRMSTEAQQFAQFIQRQNDTEKATLRLETEKLRRSEGEWLQVSMRMLDHVFALFAAAQRSGQQNVIAQIGQFQGMCLDSARRVGLVPFAGQAGEPFNEQAHRTADGNPPAAGAVVMETMAAGFSFQGQLIRPAVVTAGTPEELAAAAAPAPVVEEEPVVASAASEEAEEFVESAPVSEEPEVTLADSDPVESMPEAATEDPGAETKSAGGQPTLF
jgi:molecular chaperone GrpE (heat shock protein)